MKIRSITPVAISLPMSSPIKMSGEIVSTADNVLVRMESTDGHVGWGEAASAPLMTGETLESLQAAVRFIANGMIGSEITDPELVADDVDARMYGNSSAKSAIEMAAYDLVGRTRDVPVVELLGGSQRREAAVLWLLAANEIKEDVEAGKRMADAGFTAFKVKVALASVEEDLARCHAVRTALGRSVRISADANQGYTPEQAIAFSKGATDAGLDFIEQPVHGHDLAAMAAAAAATPVAVGADEGIHSMDDIDHHHEQRAARGASLKTIKLGGVSRVLTAAKRMNDIGMHVNLACKMADSSISSVALVHLAMALPQLDWDASPTCQYLSADISTAPLTVTRGHVRAPERPGLGIEVDESLLKRYAVKTA